MVGATRNETKRRSCGVIGRDGLDHCIRKRFVRVIVRKTRFVNSKLNRKECRGIAISQRGARQAKEQEQVCLARPFPEAQRGNEVSDASWPVERD